MRSRNKPSLRRPSPLHFEAPPERPLGVRIASILAMTQLTLRVRSRLVLADDGARASTDCVFCPQRRRSIDIDACRNCAHAHMVSPERVVCSLPEPALPEGGEAPAASVARRQVTLVRGDVPGSVIAVLLREEPWPLPVVDHEDRFLGFVSPRLLAQPRWPWQGARTLPAREVVMGASLFAPESESLANVLRVMARRGARSIALVDRSSGAVQGILFDVDALRALVSARTQASMMGRRG